MTTAHAPRQRLSEDAAISTAVLALIERNQESVSDLAYHTRISTASLYRKLGGQASWKVADVGAVARHYRLQPGDLFLGAGVLERPANRPDDDGPDGNGGEECAIGDSNPEPADSLFRLHGNFIAREAYDLVRAA